MKELDKEELKKGIKIGVEKEKEKNDLKRVKDDINRAKKMIKDNLSVEMIERYTDLPAKEIKQLQLQM